jgi:hypothetical protein
VSGEIDYRVGMSVLVDDGLEPRNEVHGTIAKVNAKTFRVDFADGTSRLVPKKWCTYNGSTHPTDLPVQNYGLILKLVDNSTEFVILGLSPLSAEQISDTVAKVMNNNAEFVHIGRFGIRKDRIVSYRVYIKK